MAPQPALTVGSVLARRGVIIGVAVAGVVAVLVVALATRADAPTILGVAVLSLVVLGLLHGNRQRRVLQWTLNQRLEQMEKRAKGHAEGVSATVTAAEKKVIETVGRSQDNTKRVILAETKHMYQGLEALLNLYSLVPAAGRIPPMRGWVASPDVLLLLVDLLRTSRPRLMVECGSGVSTLWCALAIKQFGIDGRIVALEHDENYARRTREQLTLHDVADLAEVRLAPLEEIQVGDETAKWYAMDAWADLDKIGLMFVDGPPADTAPQARFPALPLLGERLTGDAVVVLDDLIRSDEQTTVERWRAASPAILEERIVLEKNASVLRLDPGVAGSWIPPGR